MKTQGEIEAAISENVSCSEQGCRVTQLGADAAISMG